MSEIGLFHLTAGRAAEIQGTASHLEKPLQTLIKTHHEPLLGIHPQGESIS